MTPDLSIPIIEFPDDHGRTDSGPIFSIGSFEEGIARRPERARVHRHDFFEIFYFHAGQGTMFSDFQTFQVAEGSVAFASPGQVHGWPKLEGLLGRGIFFSTSFFAQKARVPSELFDFPFFFLQGGQSPALKVPSEAKVQIEAVFDLIQKEWNGDANKKIDIVRSLLDVLLMKCEQLSPQKSSSHPETRRLARSFVALVEKSYRHRLTLDEYAKKLATTPPTLIKAVKQSLGVTPFELITDRVVLEAKRLMLDPSRKISEVANYLGYDDASNFSKFIKNATGLGPAEMRRQSEESSLF